MANSKLIHTTINGDEIEFLCEPRQSLLEVLRMELGLTGAKECCNNGNCGACTANQACATNLVEEDQRERRLKEVAPVQENTALLAKAPSHAKVLHCLPAHRQEEITGEVLEIPVQSLRMGCGVTYPYRPCRACRRPRRDF